MVEAYDPVSAEGIRDFLTRYQQKFGDLLVDDVIFYPTYAFFTRALPDQPHRAQDWSFRGGFSTSGGPDGRELGTVTVDLATLDVDRLAEVLASGADRVGFRRRTWNTSSYARIRPTTSSSLSSSRITRNARA